MSYELFPGPEGGVKVWSEATGWKSMWDHTCFSGYLTRDNNSIEVRIDGVEIPPGSILRTAVASPNEGSWLWDGIQWRDTWNPVEERSCSFDGEQYTIRQYFDPNNFADRINANGAFWVSEFRSRSTACYCHKTPEGAIADSENTLLTRRAKEVAILNRGDYVAACQQFNVVPATEAEIIKSSYALEYFDLHYPEYSTDQELWSILTKKMHLLTKNNADKTNISSSGDHSRVFESIYSTASRISATAIGTNSVLLEGGSCYRCGNPGGLAGSLGKLCPDCYDDVEGDL